MINKKCMCKLTHRTGMKVSLAYWEVSRHSWRSHLADGFDGRLQIPESGNRGTYLSIAPCCHQPPDRPYWVTCCTLQEVHPQDYPLRSLSVSHLWPLRGLGAVSGVRKKRGLLPALIGARRTLYQPSDERGFPQSPVQPGEDCHKPSPLTKSFHKDLMRSGQTNLTPGNPQ